MSQETGQINCPNCGEQIDVNEILYHQLDLELKQKYNDELSKERRKYEEQQARLRIEKTAIEKQKTEYQDKLNEAIEQGVKQEKVKLEFSLKKKAEEEQADRIKSLQDELNEKSGKVKELNQVKATIEKLKREKDELKETIELEAQQRLTVQLAEEKEKIRKAEHSKSQLKISEKEQVIRQLNEQLQEAQRKAEQGSMQLQGEVQELAIEAWLREQFPLDLVEEIR